MIEHTSEVYILGVHPYAYRTGKMAKIIGMKWIKPADLSWRLCYQVEYYDGIVDCVPVSDVSPGGTYELVLDALPVPGKGDVNSHRGEVMKGVQSLGRCH